MEKKKKLKIFFSIRMVDIRRTPPTFEGGMVDNGREFLFPTPPFAPLLFIVRCVLPSLCYRPCNKWPQLSPSPSKRPWQGRSVREPAMNWFRQGLVVAPPVFVNSKLGIEEKKDEEELAVSDLVGG